MVEGTQEHHREHGGRRRRTLLIVLLAAAAVLLGAVAVILVPILFHHSAGGSGQALPAGFVSEVSATGADGRTRTVSVENADGKPVDLKTLRAGDVLTVRGTGFDPKIGIYVSICAVPKPGEKPGPCLGGVPEGAMQQHEPAAPGTAEPQSSVWITDDWAWRSFATQGYDEGSSGDFTARLLVADPAQQNLDCNKVECAVTTRADHTAVSDRVQDMMLPVAFSG
ncbi:MAG: hypothetical protein J0H64_07665 [Actinobacteria bacterium]|nr:hypothetical protein [Actinomycetota bacterium]